MTIEDKRTLLIKLCNERDCSEECPLYNNFQKYGACYSAKATESIIEENYRIICGLSEKSSNTCVSCGAEIPEGRQVCPGCDVTKETPIIAADDSNNPPEERVWDKSKLNDLAPKIKDPIKPEYYNDTKITPFDVIDDWKLNFYLGNAVKYIKRAGKKAGNSRLQDLKKIREYIDHEIRAEEVN